jgi:hypothetical protein
MNVRCLAGIEINNTTQHLLLVTCPLPDPSIE